MADHAGGAGRLASRRLRTSGQSWVHLVGAVIGVVVLMAWPVIYWGTGIHPHHGTVHRSHSLLRKGHPVTYLPHEEEFGSHLPDAATSEDPRPSPEPSPPPPPLAPVAAPFGDCPELTPYSVDCHILQSKRADPYTLARRRDANLLPDKGLEDCHLKLPKVKGSRIILNNIQLDKADPAAPPPIGSRVMCLILTYSKRHDTNLQSVRATWGKYCHGFLAFSNVTDPEIPSIYTPAFGGERYQNTWQKMRALWKYTWYHYGNEFDWFLKADDDTYIVWENLMHYLSQPDIRKAQAGGKGVYLGRRFWLQGDVKKAYTSGGAGYLLDRAALRMLVHKLDSTACDPHGQHQYEDLYAGMCLKESGIEPMDTRDELKRERFHCFQPYNHYSSKPLDWFLLYHREGMKMGIDCCSRRTISFHYQGEVAMLETHRYLYSCRGNETTSL